MRPSTINHVKTGRLIVMIADDDLAVRASLQFALEVEGFTVRVYGTGEELLESDMPARGCLVLDYNMPGVNGLQLLDRLRARGHDLPAIPITSVEKINGAMIDLMRLRKSSESGRTAVPHSGLSQPRRTPRIRPMKIFVVSESFGSRMARRSVARLDPSSWSGICSAHRPRARC